MNGAGLWFHLRLATLSALIALGLCLAASARAEPPYKVGIEQTEFVDGDRTVALVVFYPAVITDKTARFEMPFYEGLELYLEAEPAFEGKKHPLIVFSHGRGSNGLVYAWFAQTLAARGYIVAALYHYRANSFDQTIAYLANKLWQRPKDVSHAIDFLVSDPNWGKVVDARRIGVAGHSQGGFTALWVGGAKVDAGKYLAFQTGWRNNQMVPEHLRAALPLDAAPALDVHDSRVKAAFAMAPGIIKAFGMDEEGLRQLRIPTYITVGARDTQTPPKENAEFAAKYISGAELHVIPGQVDHEIFVNVCTEEGKDEFPEACIDAPGVDRVKIHEDVGKAALRFFDRHLQGSAGD